MSKLAKQARAAEKTVEALIQGIIGRLDADATDTEKLQFLSGYMGAFLSGCMATDETFADQVVDRVEYLSGLAAIK